MDVRQQQRLQWIPHPVHDPVQPPVVVVVGELGPSSRAISGPMSGARRVVPGEREAERRSGKGDEKEVVGEDEESPDGESGRRRADERSAEKGKEDGSQGKGSGERLQRRRRTRRRLAVPSEAVGQVPQSFEADPELVGSLVEKADEAVVHVLAVAAGVEREDHDP